LGIEIGWTLEAAAEEEAEPGHLKELAKLNPARLSLKLV
jgi:hypothetical protein